MSLFIKKPIHFLIAAPWVPFVPILEIVVCGAMIFGLGWANWARLLAWLSIGFIIYFGYSRYYSKLNKGRMVKPKDPVDPLNPTN